MILEGYLVNGEPRKWLNEAFKRGLELHRQGIKVSILDYSGNEWWNESRIETIKKVAGV